MHGDRDAFGILATRAMDRLVGTAGLILRDPDAADDAAQDALIRAWRDLPGLARPARPARPRPLRRMALPDRRPPLPGPAAPPRA
jgi:DNA-directed RNA polymerase specialized sigma24 family protein